MGEMSKAKLTASLLIWLFSLGSTFLTDLKNEDGYEIYIPFEDSNADQAAFCNQNDHMRDGKPFV